MLKGGAGGVQRALCTEFAWSCWFSITQLLKILYLKAVGCIYMCVCICLYVYIVYSAFPLTFSSSKCSFPQTDKEGKNHSTHICTWWLLFCSANTFCLLLIKSLSDFLRQCKCFSPWRQETPPWLYTWVVVRANTGTAQLVHSKGGNGN